MKQVVEIEFRALYYMQHACMHQDQPFKSNKQQDPTEGTTTPAAPTEVEGPPVVILDPKQSSNTPQMSKDNQNAILHQWIHRNTIQLKLRLTR